MNFDHMNERLKDGEAQQRYRIETLREARETGHALSARGSTVGARILNHMKPTERYSDSIGLPTSSRER